MPDLFSNVPPSVPQDRRKIYRVAEITRLIKATIENEVGTVWVEGEISNFKKYSSGHAYFTLKDASSQIRCVFFRGNQAGVSFELKDGLGIRVYGEVTVYEERGDYQILVRRVEAVGKGTLQEQFEKLKEKLAKEGLFEASRKKPLPLLPRHIGIVTSPTGAVIRDILNILTRRFRNLHIVVAPARVQGDCSAQEVAAGIDLLNRRGGIDVIIVARGGGSLEDLWCFNEEAVARAIARSTIPVISAVGHETDFTISDFVADLRAPTPSAAAELVVRKKQDFEDTIGHAARGLARALRTRALELRNRLTRAGTSYVFREPQNLLKHFERHLDLLKTKLVRDLRDAYAQAQQRTDRLSQSMAHRMETSVQSHKQQVNRLESQLRALSPLAVLERGFSITRLPDGTILRAAESVHEGDAVETRLHKGSFTSIVTDQKGAEHGRSTKK